MDINAHQDCTVKIYEVNNCLIDLRLKEIVRDNEAYRPESDVFDTLIYLIENRDHVIDMDEFRREVWHDGEASEFEIIRCIMKARRAIADDESNPIIEYIASSTGYRFNGEVLELEIN